LTLETINAVTIESSKTIKGKVNTERKVSKASLYEKLIVSINNRKLNSP